MDTNLSIPIVSVIMPVYNAGPFLKEAIDSILQQSFTNFEFFIIDDASTDNSVSIINTYTDKRIQFIQKAKNTGYTDSLNMAIKSSKGKYIARMDADDISYKDRFQRQYQYMEQHSDVMVLGAFYKIIGTDKVINLPLTCNEAKVVAIMHVPIAHPTAFIRSKVFKEYGLAYDKRYEPAEDYDLWTKVLEIGSIENLPDVLLRYRRHSLQQSIIRYNILIDAAVEIRLRQLHKLITFENKPYDILSAIEILTKKNGLVTTLLLKKIVSLLSDMYKSNQRKKIYDEVTLNKYLREVWLFYIFKFNKPVVKDISLLYVTNLCKITRMNSIFYLRFFKKVLLS
ncbi:MAG: glycosyltransferase [Ginsengibacter sp.]